MAHQVKTGAFEGPLELLLDLIEKQKLSINEVALAGIADAYVAEVKVHAALAPDEVANFLVVASTLMLIKSRSLLPNLPLTDEEKLNIKELESRLAKLRRTRELSRHVAEYISAGNRMFGRSALYDLPLLFYPPKGVTPLLLRERIRMLVRALPANLAAMHLPEKTVQHIVSLEDKIKQLMTRVEHSLASSFKSFAGSAQEKTEIIVSFLALLELIKQGYVVVEQGSRYGDINIMQNVEREK